MDGHTRGSFKNDFLDEHYCVSVSGFILTVLQYWSYVMFTI